MIAIVDYGAGNLMSVKKALDFIGEKSVITSDCKAIETAERVILPGVGSFGDAMDSMRQKGLDETVKHAALSGKPFLGICLGLQLLFESSAESPEVKGLGILSGNISLIPGSDGLKVPHVGWNSVETKPESRLFGDIPSGSYFYFVHSYYLNGAEPGVVAGKTNYGVDIECAVERGNLFATQFHPEKSGEIGLNLLKNFAKAEV